MKQIIGYMEYDYMNIKYGLWYMLLIFTIVCGVFSMNSGTGAVGYMLFGGLILASTAFNVTKQTIPFTALVPGSTLQKVLGRYLGGVLCMVVCAVFGVVCTAVAEAAGYENGGIEMPMLAGLMGVTLLFLALQNMMMYLLTPMLGIQFVSLIRMIPGFILFFLVMGAGRPDMRSDILGHMDHAGPILLAAGVLGLLAAVGISCLIVRGRDDE